MPRAIVIGSTSSASGTLRMCTFRICSRPLHVRQADHDLAVEAARAQQRRVEHVGTVGRGDDDHALAALEAVHLDQQLVQGLLALVVAAAQAGAAMAADRVDLVDEDDARRVLLGLLEHVAHAAGADADEHLDEVGTGDREERHLGLAGDGPRQQRLAGAGRADHQHAARDLAAELLELARVAQELDQLADFLLGLVAAGDVGEGDLDLVLALQLGARLAEAHRALAAALLHLAHEEQPEADDQHDRQEVEQDATRTKARSAAACGR